MVAEGLCEGLERDDAGAHGHAGPGVEEAAGPGGGGVGPETPELLLEEIGANTLEVDAHELAETSGLWPSEIVSALEQNPARLGEDGIVALGAQRANLLSADGIEGLVQELLDMKAIQDVHGRRGALGDHGQEGSPHIADDECDGLGAGFTEEVEEPMEGLLGAVLADPEQPLAAVVELIDESEIRLLWRICGSELSREGSESMVGVHGRADAGCARG